MVGDVEYNSHEEACNLEPGFNIASTRQTRVGEGGTVPVQGAMEYAQGDAGNCSTHVESIEPNCAISASANGPSGPMPLTLAVEFAKEPSSSTKHFFIVVDPTDEIDVEEIAAMDLDVENPESIMTFLTLLTAVPPATSRRCDHIMDFTKSIILTSGEYVTVVLEVRRTKLALAVEKEQNRQNREEAKKRKLEERKEANRLRGIRV